MDTWQQRNRLAGLLYALVKKYGDDEAGYQGALITYYGFLSLFPLLVVAVSVIDMLTRHNLAQRDKLVSDIYSYFPALGDQIQTSIHATTNTGLPLLVGLLVTIYGARGVADAVRHSLNHIWEVPVTKRAGFPKSFLRNLLLIVGGGAGFLLAAVLSGFAAAALGHSVVFRIITMLLSFAMLMAVFLFVFRIGSSAKHSIRELLPGAAIAAFGLLILQVVGGLIVEHQIRHLRGAYGQFGLVLTLLFWLYLQAQIFLYAAEFNTLRSYRLWPRSLTGKPLTRADKKAYELYARRETRQSPPEEVNVKFSGSANN